MCKNCRIAGNGNLVRSLELLLNTFIGNLTIYLNGVERSLSFFYKEERASVSFEKSEWNFECKAKIPSNFLPSIWQTKNCYMNFYVRPSDLHIMTKMIGPDAPLPQLANLYLDIRLKNRSFT